MGSPSSAAGQLDRDKRWLTNDRRPIIATLLLAGPRAGELCNLRWRDVDLANGRIRIGRSKTQAGLREIVLLPLLRDELSAHKARAYRSGMHFDQHLKRLGDQLGVESHWI